MELHRRQLFLKRLLSKNLRNTLLVDRLSRECFIEPFLVPAKKRQPIAQFGVSNFRRRQKPGALVIQTCLVIARFICLCRNSIT